MKLNKDLSVVFRRALAFDIATVSSSVSLMKDGKCAPVKFTCGGTVVPSAILCRPDGEILVGQEAELQAWKYPERFYSLFKPLLFKEPDKAIGNGPTPVQLTAYLIRYLVSEVLVKYPELAQFPQFGGNERDAAELEICFTVPAGEEFGQYAVMDRAIREAGIETGCQPIHYKTEPAAGCRSIMHEYGCNMHDEQVIGVLDFGGGTFDISFLQLKRGELHEYSAPCGDQALGGRNFTAAIATIIVEQLACDVGQAFSLESALQLEKLGNDSEREFALNIWQAAEQIKLRLSTAATASGFVQTPNGKREVKVNRAHAQEVWAPLWRQVEKRILTACQELPCSVADVPHICLIGGSSLLPGFSEMVARLTMRPIASVLLSEDSSHAVANGAAQEAYFREAAAQALIGGVGLCLADGNGGYVYRVYVRPNHIVQPNGLIVEAMGQFIRSPGGRSHLRLLPFVAKPGVRCVDPLLGREVFLDEKEVNILGEVLVGVDLPAGEHEVRVGVTIDTQRRTNLSFLPLHIPNQEPIVVALGAKATKSSYEASQGGPVDVAIILDCSKSMAGEKLNQAKLAIQQFLNDVSTFDVRTTLVTMGGVDKAKTVVELGDSLQDFTEGLKSQVAYGGTYVTEALALAKASVTATNPENSKMVILFSDGMPHNLTSAIAEANELKQFARLLCVAIGEDALAPFLEQLASTPGDYFVAKAPSDIFGCLHLVAELVQGEAMKNESAKRIAV